MPLPAPYSEHWILEPTGGRATLAVTARQEGDRSSRSRGRERESPPPHVREAGHRRRGEGHRGRRRPQAVRGNSVGVARIAGIDVRGATEMTTEAGRSLGAFVLTAVGPYTSLGAGLGLVAYARPSTG